MTYFTIFHLLYFLDLSKAFDTVNHQLLLQKLYRYGVRGNINLLLTDYLFKRTQYTYCNETASDEKEVLCGVPQGSTLGPLLFWFYVNDLPRHSNFSVRIFADDTALILRIKT